MPAPHPRARALRPAPLSLALLALALSACGGGDPLPSGGPPPPGSVRVHEVDPAGQDGSLWYTREPRVAVRGEAPAGATVEAFRQSDGSLVAGTQAGDDGRFTIEGLPVDGPQPASFALQARLPGRPLGPLTALDIVLRRSPPDPFTVDPTPGSTNARAVTVSGTIEDGVTAVVRVEGGSAPAQVRKPSGEPSFSLEVSLDPNREHRLAITASDPAGNQAGPIERIVVQDATAPPPPSAPVQVVSGDRATLRGQATDAVVVVISAPNDGTRNVQVGGDGTFAVDVSLPVEGENRFEGVAIDAAGNRSAPGTLVMVRDTVAPPPPEVAGVEGGREENGVILVPSRSVVIVGRSEPGATVEATGSNLFGTTPAGQDGAFRLPVELPATFLPVDVAVQAIDAAGNRGEARVLRLAVSFGLFDEADTGSR